MRLIKVVVICLLVLFPWNRYLSAQTLTDQEYNVINDLFGCLRGSDKLQVYQQLAPNSVYKDFIEADPELFQIPVSMDEEEIREMIRNFEVDKKRLDSQDQTSWVLKKSKLDRRIKIKKSPEKGALISRPLISGGYAILYSKTPCLNYSEGYIVAKKIVATNTWVYYGYFTISERYVEILVQKNWRWRSFWRSVNIFRNRYCD